MSELEIWLLFGHKRAAGLAKILGCSRQNVRKETVLTERVLDAINQVEKKEMSNSETCKFNIIRAAELTVHSDDRVRNRAYFNLVVWSEIYARISK